MKHTKFGIFMAMATFLCCASSCNKNMFNEEDYKTIIERASQVDSVDAQHTWQLGDSLTFHLSIPEDSKAERVCIFSGNPVDDEYSELVAQTFVSPGDQVDLAASIPSLLDMLYAAYIDSDGLYTVTRFSKSSRDVDFSSPLMERRKVRRTRSPQTYTYLYEEDFPEPGDYDYNDLVLNIAQQRTGQREITLTVSVAAVGATKQLAAAVRLVGYKIDDIESVTTTDGTSFNDGVPSASLYAFDSTDMLLAGRNNEAVINLFVDAHWAMGYNLKVEYGLFERKKYNVSNTTDEKYQLKSVHTISYKVVFKSAERLNQFCLDTLDPFVVEDYNGSHWEIHLEPYRTYQVFYEYQIPSISKMLPWALRIPSGDFRHPLEGIHIGIKKQGATFGAYMEADHSFGDWVEYRNKARDWYLYPTNTAVF